MTLQLRQGDLLITRVSALPAGLTARKAASGRLVLAYGEVTGHHHSFADDGAVALLEAPGTDQLYLAVDRLSELQHQEHATITVEPGTYRVVRQREYDPSEVRSVAD